MSLAEELLADLESEDEEEQQEEAIPDHEEHADDRVDDEDGGEEGDGGESAMDTSDGQKKKATGVAGVGGVSEVATLFHSDRLHSVLERMAALKDDPRGGLSGGPVESDPNYQLLVEANNLAAQIDEEVSTIFKFAKDKYSVRFPELETLVVAPLDYLLTARELGNSVLRAKNNKVLEQFLTQATIMVVSVTASTTQGTDLSASELAHVDECCDMAIGITEHKKNILAFVESKMSFMAPNLSTIIGAATAAKLMGAAGGLTALSKMPSGHVSLLGQQKKTLSGFNHRTTLPHTGFIFASELVQDVPADLRRKVARVVGDKCTLAARVDAQHESLDGAVGLRFREEIDKKIDKFQEPPPVKAIKALPTPLEAPKKKRGGRRVRQQKERYAVTELRKQANRMNFGELEEDVYQSDLGYTRGNIGKGGTGAGIRAAQIDERTKVRISQTLKKNLQKQQASWGGTTSIKKHVSGTASSVAFTPLQGLEIVNPNANESDSRAEEANAKYFSSSAAFMKVKTPKPNP